MARKRVRITARRKTAKPSKTETKATNLPLRGISEQLISQLKRRETRRMIVIIMALIILGWAGLRYRYALVPAAVNGQPIFIWEYLTKLHQIAGEQVLNQVITEKLIFQEAIREGIAVTPEQLDEEEKKLEEQFAQAGGLDAVIANQGMTRHEFERQMRLSILVRDILVKTATVSAEEVDREYEANNDQYSDVPEDEAKRRIRETLENQYAQEQITPWLENLKTTARVEIYLPQQ